MSQHVIDPYQDECGTYAFTDEGFFYVAPATCSIPPHNEGTAHIVEASPSMTLFDNTCTQLGSFNVLE